MFGDCQDEKKRKIKMSEHKLSRKFLLKNLMASLLSNVVIILVHHSENVVAAPGKMESMARLRLARL